ncbi:hypothetical protein MycrhDRAFT_5541 [Mycolicibacterium rhodesiae JS60]|nr:hypothetical protein MycrhDRAFT_5541 [Mycolicibacterium rhodesiae JS60]
MIPPAPASAAGIPPDSAVQIVLTECCNLQCRHCAVPAEDSTRLEVAQRAATTLGQAGSACKYLVVYERQPRRGVVPGPSLARPGKRRSCCYSTGLKDTAMKGHDHK